MSERIDDVLEEAMDYSILTPDQKEALRSRLDEACSRACVAAMQEGASLMLELEDLADSGLGGSV